MYNYINTSEDPITRFISPPPKLIILISNMEPTFQLGRNGKDTTAEGLSTTFVGVDVGLGQRFVL